MLALGYCHDISGILSKLCVDLDCAYCKSGWGWRVAEAISFCWLSVSQNQTLAVELTVFGIRESA